MSLHIASIHDKNEDQQKHEFLSNWNDEVDFVRNCNMHHVHLSVEEDWQLEAKSVTQNGQEKQTTRTSL